MKVDTKELIKIALIILLISGMDMKKNRSLRHDSEKLITSKIMKDVLKTLEDYLPDRLEIRVDPKHVLRLKNKLDSLKKLINQEKSDQNASNWEEIKKEIKDILVFFDKELEKI